MSFPFLKRSAYQDYGDVEQLVCSGNYKFKKDEAMVLVILLIGRGSNVNKKQDEGSCLLVYGATLVVAVGSYDDAACFSRRSTMTAASSVVHPSNNFPFLPQRNQMLLATRLYYQGRDDEGVYIMFLVLAGVSTTFLLRTSI